MVVRRVLWLLVALSLPALGQSGSASADGRWFFDTTSKAGGAQQDSNGGTYALGVNTARTGEKCHNTSRREIGQKRTRSLQQPLTVEAQCQSGGTTARGSSYLSVGARTATGYYVVASATSEVLLTGINPDPGHADAYYEDPTVLTKMTPDFKYAVTLGVKRGTSLRVSAKSTQDNATSTVRITSDAPALKEIFRLNVAAGGVCDAVVVTSKLVELLDPIHGKRMTIDDVKRGCRAAISGKGRTAADRKLVTVVVAFGAAGVKQVAVGNDITSSASAAPSPSPKPIP